MPSCSSERKLWELPCATFVNSQVGWRGGVREKRADKLEWVKLTQLKWIHNIVNNTRRTVSRGCCSFIFKCFRYAVVLQPSSPTVFGRVQPDSWLPAFDESPISETIPPLPATFSYCKEVPDLDRALRVQCSVWALPQVLQYFYFIDGGLLRSVEFQPKPCRYYYYHPPKTIEKSWGNHGRRGSQPCVCKLYSGSLSSNVTVSLVERE